jgi:alcohol dehydrogenase
MNFNNFCIARLPVIHFGAGTITKVPELAAELGQRALLVTGKRSFKESSYRAPLLEQLELLNIHWYHAVVSGEPSPSLVDELVKQHRGNGIDVVIGIGGGSVLDAAKAAAGLLPFGNSVLDHLEGVGRGIAYSGPSLPLIAVPTTAGTGSEATKNAVLSEIGTNGYKKSFRHDTLVPRHAVVDPELLTGCSQDLIAANGMDAFTQLLESYVSSNANPFTDALALSGLEAVKNGLLPAWHRDGEDARYGRAAMAYAALLSGITLAQVGLGSVHGLASPLGAFFPVSHGVVCGLLLATATEVNITAMRQREPGNPALAKYARVGQLLGEDTRLGEDAAIDVLLARLRHWSTTLFMPRLADFGITEDDFDRIVANSRGNSMKTNPVVLTDDEIRGILHRCL